MNNKFNSIQFIRFFQSGRTCAIQHGLLGNIPKRCVVHVMYFRNTNDFSFISLHTIPIMWDDVDINNAKISNFKPQHTFHKWSLKFLKAQCFFTIIYYKRPLLELDMNQKDPGILNSWITNTAYGYGVLEGYPSNLTYCLILYHQRESDAGRPQIIIFQEFKGLPYL